MGKKEIDINTYYYCCGVLGGLFGFVLIGKTDLQTIALHHFAPIIKSCDTATASYTS